MTVSCSSPTKNENEHVLPEKTMVGLIKETMLIEAHLNEIRVDQIYIKDSADNYYAEVFERYNTNKEEFDRSMQFYAKQPELIDSMYSLVLDELLEMEVKLDAVQINTENIQPIGKNVVVEIIHQTPHEYLFFADSISKEEIRDSLSIYLEHSDSILRSRKTNLSSFMMSLNNIMHNEIIYSSLLTDLKNKDLKK